MMEHKDPTYSADTPYTVEIKTTKLGIDTGPDTRAFREKEHTDNELLLNIEDSLRTIKGWVTFFGIFLIFSIIVGACNVLL